MYGDEISENGARLHLVSNTEKGIPLPPIVNALNALPAPMTAATWHGESAQFYPDFISPGALELAKAKPAFPIEPDHRKSIRLGYNHFRPEGKMPIAAHTEVGSLLKSVLAVSFHRRAAYKRLAHVRCELDDWVQNEYSHDELPSEQFFNLYYREKNTQFLRALSAEQCDAHVASLDQVKTILGRHYTNSVPLRQMFKQLDLVTKSLRGWVK